MRVGFEGRREGGGIVGGREREVGKGNDWRADAVVDHCLVA